MDIVGYKTITRCNISISTWYESQIYVAEVARRADALAVEAAAARAEAAAAREDVARQRAACDAATAECSGLAGEAERQRDAAQARELCARCRLSLLLLPGAGDLASVH